jgi:hypothetical protein
VEVIFQGVIARLDRAMTSIAPGFLSFAGREH